MDISALTQNNIICFLGWCSLINVIIICATTLAIVCFKQPVTGFYARLLNLEPDHITKLFFRFLLHYEIAVLMLNIVPYLALKIIS